MNEPISRSSASRCARADRQRHAFIEVDRAPFRQALAKTTFYKDWKAKFGDEAWAHLEKDVGQAGVTAMAHVTTSKPKSRTAAAGSRRHWAARINAALIPLVEIPAALLVVAEIVVLLAGIIGRYVFHAPHRLVGRTRRRSCSCGLPCWAQ